MHLDPETASTTSADRGPLNAAPRTSLDVVDIHSRAEGANDIERIMGTISDWDVQFALVADAQRGLVTNEAHELATVRGWYEANRGGYDLIAGSGVRTKQVVTAWYRFHEVYSQITHIGAVPEGVPHPPFPAPGEGGTQADGGPYWFPMCVLFPTAPDGICGELGVWQFDMAELFGGYEELAPAIDGPVPYMNGIEFRNAQTLARLNESWAAGDVDAMLSLFRDDCYSVLRTVELVGTRRDRVIARGHDEHRRAFDPETFGRIESLRLISTVQSPWYVFAEYDLDLELDDGRIRRQMATVYPISRSGQILGRLAYAVDSDDE
jgi:hypothetical protein